ncbi:unnamed protein product [Brassica napus]|uniref:(rape) hypothetical protein n=1 Tax=Brassica napus TaxID=3708 RepID=A0A816XU05_BRANA|nr:unnamed protein product [Brassica napus]
MLCSEARRRSYPPPLPMASPPPEDDQARMTNNGKSDSDILTPQSSQYDFKTIEAAINKFARSNKLVEGGFGEVTLSNGIEVAVKLLSKKSGKGIRELKNEVVLVSKLQHMNLVGLLGFCLEEEETMLIYEFVPNKSLNYFIFGTENQSQLYWTQ